MTETGGEPDEVERLEHELAARAPIGRWPERAAPIEDRGCDAPIIDPQP